MKAAARIFVVTLGVVVTFLPAHPAVLAQRPPTAALTRFHHVHLNSVNPKAAAEYYPKPFAASAAMTTFNGYEAVKTGNRSEERRVGKECRL